MPIPRVIYQTFKTNKLPFINRWYINKFRKKNIDFDYEFYDDERIESFLKLEFEPAVYEAYKKIKIGAAKADFFRYAILYKKGGVYLDIDSDIRRKLSGFIMEDDSALISKEDHGDCYLQWALIFEAHHPFLKRCVDLILENIRNNQFANDVLNFSGPKLYTKAINECLAENPNVHYRLMGVDYNGNLKYQFPLSKFFLYEKKEHWTEQQKINKAFE